MKDQNEILVQGNSSSEENTFFLQNINEDEISFLDNIFFKQERIGKDGIPFTVYKIKTMINDACNNMPPEILNHEKKCTNDTRILPNRKWMRRLGIDEIPQIINIMKGQMSFFGPRPLITEIFNNLPQEDREKRKQILPGVFGSYAFWKKDRERSMQELDNIYLYLRERKERERKSLIPFHAWIFVNTIRAIIQGANK